MIFNQRKYEKKLACNKEISSKEIHKFTWFYKLKKLIWIFNKIKEKTIK